MSLPSVMSTVLPPISALPVKNWYFWSRSRRHLLRAVDLPLAADLGRHDPEIDVAAVDVLMHLRLPVAHVEGMRDDAAAGLHGVEDLRTQPQVDVGEQIHRHHVGLRQVLLEQVGDLELDLVGDAGLGGVLVGFLDALRVDVDAEAARAAAWPPSPPCGRRRSRNRSCSRLADLGELQHPVHHLLRGRNVDHVEARFLLRIRRRP